MSCAQCTSNLFGCRHRGGKKILFFNHILTLLFSFLRLSTIQHFMQHLFFFPALLIPSFSFFHMLCSIVLDSCGYVYLIVGFVYSVTLAVGVIHIYCIRFTLLVLFNRILLYVFSAWILTLTLLQTIQTNTLIHFFQLPNFRYYIQIYILTSKPALFQS